MSESLKPVELSQANTHVEAEDEINLLDLLLVILKHKLLIILLPLLVAGLAAGYASTLKNIYKANVVIIATASDKKNDGIGAALGSLGGLASLAGVSLSGGGSNEESLAVLKSRDFLWQFVQEKNLLPILFADEWDKKSMRWKEKQPSQMQVYRLLTGGSGVFETGGLLNVEVDKKTNLITVSIEWSDAQLASDWANLIVDYLNQYLAQRAMKRSERNLKYLNEALVKAQIEEFRRTLFELIAQDTKNSMLASAQKDFAFKVIDSSIPPDKKIKPKRGTVVMLAGLVALFLAIIWAFISEAIQRGKAQPEHSARWVELRQAMRFW